MRLCGIWHHSGRGRGILTVPIGSNSPGSPVHELLADTPIVENITASDGAAARSFAWEYARPSSIRPRHECSLCNPKPKIGRSKWAMREFAKWGFRR
jgi:hypothetical protein